MGKRYHQLTITADESVLDDPNYYFAVDKQNVGTPKLPANAIAKRSVQDDLAQLKNVPDHVFLVEDTAAFTVQNGGIKADGDYGGSGDAAGKARVGRKSFDYVVLTSSTYLLCPYYYTSNTGSWPDSYVGHGEWTDKVSPKKDYYCAISLKRADGVAVDASDIAALQSAIHYYNLTDATLSQAGAPADAKKVGDELANIHVGKVFSPDVSVNAKYIDGTDGTLVDSTAGQRTYTFNFVPSDDLVYYISGRIGTAANMCLAATYDADGNFIESYVINNGTAKEFYRLPIIVNPNARSIKVQGHSSYVFPKFECDVFKNKFVGKKMSVMGASMCTFSGYIPVGYATYYPKAGVNYVEEMWWERLRKMLKMDRLVINAYSGSKVSDIGAGAGYSNFVPMASDERAMGLGDGVDVPDVVFIQAGVNDFSKAGDVLGTWNGGAYPVSFSNFRDAFAVMLAKITNTYPSAKVYVLGLPPFCRTEENPANGVESSHSEHKSFADYDGAMRDMCDMFGCQFIPMNVYSRSDLLANYCEADGGKTHPNSKGHKVWADWVYENI